MPPTLYLIDGHALAYRMYFALTRGTDSQRWRSSKGEPTAGTYGFARELLRILSQERPEYLMVAFDTGRTFRDQIYPEYKATRLKMPDDLTPQIERIRQLVDAFNLPRLEVEGYEADDVLGSLARRAAARGLGVKIITGDRDLLQLVNEYTVVYLAGDDKTYITAEDVIEKLGVRPQQVVDYKALVGDKSDNIPGVRGIGEKTAIALLERFHTLDNIYAHLDQVEEGWRRKLEQGREAAYMSRELARIRTDLPLELNLEQARAHDFEAEKVKALFSELEFRSLFKPLEHLLREIASAAAAHDQPTLFDLAAPAVRVVQPAVSIEVHVIDTSEKLERLAAALARAPVIAFDTETTSTDEMRAALVGLSFAIREGEGYYVPLGHRLGNNLPLEEVMARLGAPLTEARISKIAHHAKYDYIVLARHGLRVSPITFDTMIAEFVLDPASRNLGLKNLAAARLGEQMTHIEDLIGSGRKQISMAEVDVSVVAAYAAADAEVTLRLLPILRDGLQRVNAQRLMDEIEVPLIPVLAEMQLSGVLLDLPFFESLSREFSQRMAEIEKRVYEAVGKVFNLNSTQQLSEVLFTRLRLPPPDRTRKTTSGHYSTSADILDALRGQHPVVDWVLQHRELSKLKSTYIEALPAAVDPATGRVHTSYSQTGAVTGRLSSSNPNLQNIPIRSEEGRRIRRGFIAPADHVLLSADYSQIELRLAAHMSKDEGMLAAFRGGQDIHAATAAALYRLPLDQVTPQMRRHAKAINFGLLYGMSPFGLTRSTDLTLAEAEDFVRTYFEQFPGIKRYLDGIRQQAAQQGYVETLLGRRRYFPALRGRSRGAAKSREEREAINAPIQGSAADIIKMAMIRIPPALRQAGLHARMLLQVHDELVLEAPQDELESTVTVVRRVMETAYPLDAPLVVETRYGPNWGEMRSV